MRDPDDPLLPFNPRTVSPADVRAQAEFKRIMMTKDSVFVGARTNKDIPVTWPDGSQSLCTTGTLVGYLMAYNPNNTGTQ